MKGLSLLDEVLLVLLLLLRVLYATIDKGPTCCRVNEGSSNVFLADREQLSVCTGPADSTCSRLPRFRQCRGG
jgi:hypothetical protein